MRTLLCLALLALPAAAADDPLAPLIKKLNSTFDMAEGANGLAKLGAKARPAIKDLGAALAKGRFERERVAAANALEKIVTASLKEKEELVGERRTAKGASRERLDKEIDAIDADVKAAVAGLAPALAKATFKDDRLAVTRAIGACGPAGAGAVKELAAAIKGGFSENQIAVIKVLGGLGPLARDAVPALTAASKTGFLDVRKAAADALAKIGK